MALKRKTLLYYILSVVTGIACCFIIFFVLIAFSMALGLLGWSNAGDKKYLKRLELTSAISLIVSAAAALLGGIAIIYNMIKSRKEEGSFPSQRTSS